MSNNNSQISVTYTDAELRNLIEEFITQRKEEFSLRDACSYILYWSLEDGKTVEGKTLIESDELQQADQDCVRRILEDVIADGRIVANSCDCFSKR